jgi:ankyrin repeat protein
LRKEATEKYLKENSAKNQQKLLAIFDSKLDNSFQAYIQTYVNRKLAALTRELELVNVEAFLQNIDFHFQPTNYSHLFNTTQRPTGQNSLLSSSVGLSTKLEEQGGLCGIDSFSGIYSKEKLNEYFKTLADSFKEAKEPVCLMLSNENHAMGVIYDPKDKSWSFINPNDLPKKDTTSIEKLTSLVAIGFNQVKFSPNDQRAFSTHIYTSSAKEAELKPLIEKWHSTSEMVKLHEPTKATQTETYGSSWLYIAAAEGDEKTTAELLQHGADPNKFLAPVPPASYAPASERKEYESRIKDCGITPLYIAAQEGHTDVVRVLLKSDTIDVNKKDAKGRSPLTIAAICGRKDVIELLLKDKRTNPNIQTELKSTPLWYAAEVGNKEIVRDLLKHKADPNLCETALDSPLYNAGINGHFEIVKILLENKADPKLIHSDQATANLIRSKAYSEKDPILKAKIFENANFIDLFQKVHKITLDSKDSKSDATLNWSPLIARLNEKLLNATNYKDLEPEVKSMENLKKLYADMQKLFQTYTQSKWKRVSPYKKDILQKMMENFNNKCEGVARGEMTFKEAYDDILNFNTQKADELAKHHYNTHSILTRDNSTLVKDINNLRLKK